VRREQVKLWKIKDTIPGNENTTDAIFNPTQD